MSGDPRAQAAAAAGAILGGTGGLLTAASLITGKGRFSGNSYAVHGTKVLDQAEETINKMHRKGEVEDYIIPDNERNDFIKRNIEPLEKEGEKIEKATRTFPGSLIYWTSAREFSQQAQHYNYEAERLSQRSLREYRAREDASKIQGEEHNAQDPQSTPGANGYQQEACPDHITPHTMFPHDRTEINQRRGPGSEGFQSTSHHYPPIAIKQGSVNDSQYVNCSTAQGSQHAATQQYSAGIIHQSPTGLQGPSFDNFQQTYPAITPKPYHSAPQTKSHTI